MRGNKKHAFSVPYFEKISILFIFRVAFVFSLANTLGNCAFSSKANIRRVRVDRVDTLKARKPKYIIMGTTSHSLTDTPWTLKLDKLSVIVVLQ